MAKIIDITSRLNAQNQSRISEIQESGENAEVVPMTQARQQLIRQERRSAKRTILNEFIGAFVVLPEKGLLRVSIFDISDVGLSFDLAIDEGHFEAGEKIAMRIYLNHKTFFPFIAEMTNVRFFVKQGVARHGVNFMKGSLNDVAIHHFVKFIENISGSLRTDSGDMQAPIRG